MDEPVERRPSRGWWKWVLAGVGAVLAAAIAWGAAEPEPEPEPEPDAEPEPHGPAPGVAEPTAAAPPDGARAAAATAPTWVRPTILWAIGALLVAVVAVVLVGIMRQVIVWLFLALFFSFALEPAVNFLHDRWHWRRGLATFALMAAAFLFLVFMTVVFAAALIQGLIALVARLPEWAASVAAWVEDVFGVQMSTTGVDTAADDATNLLATLDAEPLELLLGVTVGVIDGFFAFFTVAMFCFYMVAEGSRFKRAVLSFFPRARQDELVSIWEAAIDKTGGYFYSRMLVAVINGVLSFIVLSALDVPGAVPLAAFQGFVAAFIPIVGTYVGSAVPIIVALFAVGPMPALIYLVYVLIYQQVENFWIAPKLQGRTMALHPAVAFGAALAGGALGGLLWAFLALPFAATVQASASLWIQRHEVLESAFVADEHPSAPASAADEASGRRLGRWFRARRGWLRRAAEEAGGEVDVPTPAIDAPTDGSTPSA